MTDYRWTSVSVLQAKKIENIVPKSFSIVALAEEGPHRPPSLSACVLYVNILYMSVSARGRATEARVCWNRACVCCCML